MNKFRFMFKALAIAVFTFAFASMAQAQATRTWVSGVGDDVNPCSRTAPCKTFAGAISKTAASGEIDALDPAGFGAVTITKNITIDGGKGSGFGGILASLTTGVIVNDSGAGTIVVTLRNLSMNGAGNGTNGIRFISGKSLIVEDCQIFGFRGSPGHGIDMGITTAGQNAQLSVRGTTIHDNAGNGINMNVTGASASGTLIMDNSRLARMANGISMVAGLTRASVSRSSITLMSVPGNAINMSGGSPIIHVDSTNLSHNTTGIAATVGSARIQNVYITNSATSMTTAANVRSWGDNMIFENGTNTLPGGVALTKE